MVKNMNSPHRTAGALPPALPRTGTPSPKSRDILRIVQVETFYQPYLDQFYTARPEIAAAPHATQITALLADGFSALHNVAPYLEPLGYEAHFIVANAADAQRAWLRENGVSFPAGTPVSFADVLRAQIDALDPDILYFSDAITFGADFVRGLKRRPRLVVGWHAAPIPSGTDWSSFDLFVSGLSAMRAMASRLGARAAESYMPGFPEWLAAATVPAERTKDVVFTGSYTPVQHARRNQWLQAIGDQADAGHFRCAYHLTTSVRELPASVARWRRDPVFGIAMHRALASGHIVFDARSSMIAQGADGTLFDVAGRETANMRLFEATGSGAFLLTERMDNLARYFNVGKEVETFADEGELLEKIRHYLDHPDERAAIAAAGQRRCLDEHGMSRRVHLFDGLLRRHLPPIPAVAVPSAPASGPIRHFCTYFDGAYAVRGLAMMASVSQFLPDARFHVLCLDDTAAGIVADQRPDACIVRLDILEAFDPELAACRANRSKFEYYFTCTPCLPRYVLNREVEADMVTYLDADLFFYQSPELVFAEIGAASVAIAHHRFTPKLAPGRIRYGRYNVGWVSWRNDAEGRRCLEDYRTDCLTWCYDRLEENRFADQKYLDAWPTRYEGVHELVGKGMNLALWNVDDCTLGERDGTIHADDDPLVFMHFHGVKHVGPTSWDLRFREYEVTGNQPFLTDRLYRPYLTLLQGSFDRLAPIYGLAVPGDPRFNAAGKDALPPAPPPPQNGVVRYRIIDRAQAMALTADDGWAFADVAERQDASFAELVDEMQAGRPRLDFRVAAAAVTAAGMERPSLLEVGCASGYYRHVFDRLVPGGVRYLGVDKSPALIELARSKHPDLRFDAAGAEALPYPDGAVDIVYNGVSLMHIVDYEAAIAEARRVARRWCIFHTVPVLQQRPTTFLTKEAYGRPVVEIIINEAELRLLFARYGLTIRKIWESIPYDLSAVLGEATPTRSFLCEVADPLSPARPALLNIGCGVHFHTDWANIDVQPRSPAVMGYDVRRPLPYPDGTFDMVYHSHVLEHLPRAAASVFLADCRRALKPGGVIRIAVPDLEQIAREYIHQLDRAAMGDGEAAARYDWIMVELLDQIGRHWSGGEMQSFLAADPLPAEGYILSRIGDEGRGLIAALRGQPGVHTPPVLSDEELGRFRRSGEAHLWMYDRFSLRRLLEDAGFTGCRVVPAWESSLPGYQAYGLDVLPDGNVRKPDSLFMEARKPQA